METKWQYQNPTKNVVIKELPDNMDESRLARRLNNMGVKFEDIRFVAKGGPGGKGFAQVMFFNTKEAVDWVEQQQGCVSLQPGHNSGLLYSQMYVSQPSEALWDCECGALNVDIREACFRCDLPRPVGPAGLARIHDRPGGPPGPGHRGRPPFGGRGRPPHLMGGPGPAAPPARNGGQGRGGDLYDPEEFLETRREFPPREHYERRAPFPERYPPRGYPVEDFPERRPPFHGFPEEAFRGRRDFFDDDIPLSRGRGEIERGGRRGFVEVPRPGLPRSPAKPSRASEDGSDQLGLNPCNTVLLRGLDGLSDEKKILDSLAEITSLEPKSCYVMRNLATSISLGYGFMEFDTVADAKRIVDYFSNQEPFEVDGKLLLLDYAKNTLKTIMAGISRAKEQFESVRRAKEEKEKMMKLTEEQREKEKEADRQRQEMFRRDLELKEKQEHMRKKAEEAMDKIRKQKAEEFAKAKAAAETAAAAAAKVSVESFTGFAYDNETGLYKEKGQFVPERCMFVGHSMANNLDLRIFDEKEIVPNGKFEDLIAAALKLMNASSLQGYRVCCYIFFGITDLLEVKQAQGYREVVLRENGDSLLMSKIDWGIKSLKENNILPMLCTFPPMSFVKHNQFLFKNGITGKLELKQHYQTMQIKLNEHVAKVNTQIEKVNCENGVVTCQLSNKVFVQERGRHILKDVYLKDGLHLTNQGSTVLNVELAQNLRKSKQGKRSPEWLRKSHQIKSSSSISFSIKKKEESQQIKVKPDLSLKSVATVTKDSEYSGDGAKPDSLNNVYNSSRRQSRSPKQYSRSPRRNSASPRHRSRSPIYRSRSPRHQSRSSRHRNRSSRDRSRSSRDRSRSSQNRGSPQRRFSSGSKTASTSSVPKYQAVHVPHSEIQSSQDQIEENKKTHGSFTLSAFLGSLNASKAEQDDTMSMSPPQNDRDPDILVRKSPSHENTQSDTKSVSRFHSQGPRSESSKEKSQHRYRSRTRRSRSRSRRRRSRSRERRRSRSRNRDSFDRRHRSRSTSTVDRFGRIKRKNEEDNFRSKVPGHKQGLLGDAPKSLLGNGPDSLLVNEDLMQLARGNQELSGTNNVGQMQTLSNLSQLTGSSMDEALELQKEALAREMNDTLERQKSKIFKMIKKESDDPNDPFNVALNMIYQNAQAGNFPSSNDVAYGYGHDQSSGHRDYEDRGGYGGY